MFFKLGADEERRANERVKFERWAWNKPTKFFKKIDKVYRSVYFTKRLSIAGRAAIH